MCKRISIDEIKKKIPIRCICIDAKFKNVVVLKTAELGTSYDEFLKELPPKECRWAVVYFDFELKDGGKREKIVFIQWAPDTAKLKAKMLTSSTKATLKKALVGATIEIQATSSEEVVASEVLAKCLKYVR